MRRSAAARQPDAIQFPPVDYDVALLRGGLDLVTPTLSLKSGVLRDALNFECSPTGGYSRIVGYERLDGLPAPSSGVYSIVQIVGFTNTPTLGQTLTGQTSAATGVIVALGANYIVLTKVVGAFTTTEVVKVGATAIGTATALTADITSLLDAQYTAAAADSYRADILQVPGSGGILGVFGFMLAGVDTVYAFRNNAGATAAALYKSSGSGWTLVNLANEVSFTAGGVTIPLDGATLTQGGNTALIKRVVTQTGSWAAGTAAGRFVVATPAPGNFAAGAATIGGINVTLSGAQTPITLLPGGRFETVTGNFSGQASTIRVYGVDGVNRGWEFDGTTFTPISTGAAADAPTHLQILKNYLMFALGSSLMYSGPGTPYIFSATLGGGEIAVGDTITNLLLEPGAQTTGTMAVFTRNATLMLYGTSGSTWNLVPFNDGTGAISSTAQNMSETYTLDDRGISSIKTSLAYGNFEQSALTPNIRPFIDARRNNTLSSTLCRNKSQYRLFFGDGSGLFMTIVNGSLIGSAPTFFPDQMNCAWNGKLADGDEAIYCGSKSNGYVFQLEKGTSLDGQSIGAFISTNWNPTKSPRMLKRYRHASIEMQGTGYAALNFGYSLGYGTTDIDQPATMALSSQFQAFPRWDTFTWDQFTWDGKSVFPSDVDLTGTAENIQLTISSGTNYIPAFTLNSVILHYTPRRGMR